LTKKVFFLVLKQPRLMFASFIACSLLAIYLKITTDQELRSTQPNQNQEVINIALVDISNLYDDEEATLKGIFDSEATVISVPDIDPMIYEFLVDTLKSKYPFATPRIGFDPGIAVFSKYEIENQEPFLVDGMPNIIGSFKLGNGVDIFFITSNTLPPFYSKDYRRLKKQLDKVAEKANEIHSPIITFADYNLVLWQDEIHDFRGKARLKDSRRGFFNSPHDHIFFSKHFNCVGFKNLKSKTNRLGIQASFQLNSNNQILINDERTTQKF